MTQGTASPHAEDEPRSSHDRGAVYVYGVVPAAFELRSPVRGLDDVPVQLARSANATSAAALISVLESDDYAPAQLEERVADVNWIAPRAAAHDRVLTWASDHGPVVPFPMFSMFSGGAAIQTMLRDRSADLARALDRAASGREYGVRLYRVDRDVLGAVTQLSPRLAELEQSAAAAPPGQRYLLQRKLETSMRDEVRAVGRSLADALWQALRTHSVESARSAIPRAAAPEPDAAGGGTMILNASFLIAPGAMERFQSTLTKFSTEHGAHGFRVAFTGPWPPYHFVGDAGGEPGSRGVEADDDA